MPKIRLPWTRAQKRSDPELPVRPPLLLGPVSNGEIFRDGSELAVRTTRLILEKAEHGARRLGIDRREFLASSMGMATSLWAINMASGCGGDGRALEDGGSSSLPTDGGGCPISMLPGDERGRRVGRDGGVSPGDAAATSTGLSTRPIPSRCARSCWMPAKSSSSTFRRITCIGRPAVQHVLTRSGRLSAVCDRRISARSTASIGANTSADVPGERHERRRPVRLRLWMTPTIPSPIPRSPRRATSST